MGRSRYEMTERKIRQWTAEGRGTGRGSSYRPWLTIHDVPTHGLAVRVKGSTTGRIHHLLSGVERAVFLECDWSAAVIDIREQMPLPRPATRLIASQMGVRHPRQRSVDVVMTTDLLLLVKGQDTGLSFDLPSGIGRRWIALSVKNIDQDLSSSDLDKLEIERRYWKQRNVEWRLIFKSDMPEKRWLKLMWLHEWLTLDFMPETEASLFRKMCGVVISFLADAKDSTAGAFTARIDGEQGWPEGTTLSALRHLAANRRILTSTDSLYDAWGPLSQFQLPSAFHTLERSAA